MEYLPEGIAPLRHWYINPNETTNKYKSSLLSLLTKALTEHFLQGNIPLRHLLNAKPPFTCVLTEICFNEVNDWALNTSHENLAKVILGRIVRIRYAGLPLRMNCTSKILFNSFSCKNKSTDAKKVPIISFIDLSKCKVAR